MATRSGLCSTFAIAMAGAIVLSSSPDSGASPITYIETVVGSGSLGGTAFTNQTVTLTVTADTNNVTDVTPNFLAVASTSTTVSVTGFAPATFITPTYVFDAQLSSVVGIGSGTIASPSHDVLDVSTPALSTYSLRTSIGPMGGDPAFNPGATFSTTAGLFSLASLSLSPTFQATTTTTPTQAVAAPEPPAIVSSGLAALCWLVYARRRRRRAAG